LLKLRMFRPFPFKDIADKLKNAKLVAVMEKGISPGSYGPLFLEVNTALYELKEKPLLVNYIYGLGGRDLVPDMVENMVKGLFKELETGLVQPRLRYLGVRE